MNPSPFCVKRREGRKCVIGRPILQSPHPSQSAEHVVRLIQSRTALTFPWNSIRRTSAGPGVQDLNCRRGAGAAAVKWQPCLDSRKRRSALSRSSSNSNITTRWWGGVENAELDNGRPVSDAEYIVADDLPRPWVPRRCRM